jgi:hypothetical protein
VLDPEVRAVIEDVHAGSVVAICGASLHPARMPVQRPAVPGARPDLDQLVVLDRAALDLSDRFARVELPVPGAKREAAARIDRAKTETRRWMADEVVLDVVISRS